MTVLLSPVQLADIERQKAEFPLCERCKGDDQLVTYQCPDCVNGRIPQPLYIVGEGRACLPGCDNCNDGDCWLPPAGWPVVGERVKCETCGGSMTWKVPYTDFGGNARTAHHECPDCNDGSTLPRVELTVTCPNDECFRGLVELDESSDGDLHGEPCPACDGETEVPWGSAIWQTLPVVGWPSPMHLTSPHFEPPSYPCIVVIGLKAFVVPFKEWVWPDAGPDALPLDPASVRPGSFVAILTDIEQP